MNLNLRAPINLTSYGYVSQYFIREAIKADTHISLFPIGGTEVEKQEDVGFFRELVKNQSTFSPSAPSLTIFHQFALAESVGRGPRIGYVIFELNRFNDREKHHLASLDKCIVCSAWAKEIVEKEVPGLPVSVAPLGVDTSIFFPAQSQSPKTIFLNASKIELRKGHDVLIDAFNMAFEQNDNVELWMMWHNPFLSKDKTDEWINLYKNSKLGEKIRILPRVQTHVEVADIFRQVDCGVFPSRAEGWNLEALEMMSCGKSVIMTDYSGHTEFANTNNALLIPCTSLEPAIDDIWFHGNGDWMDFGMDELDCLVDHMRAVHCTKHEQGNMPLNENGIRTAQRFSWQNTARLVLSCM